MLLTEEEAKEKECCIKEWLESCTASNCMAWRWGITPEEAKGNKYGPRGYCGLAGPVE